MSPVSLLSLKYRIKQHPWIFYLASRNSYREGFLKRAVDRRCDVVIEGFPRSANTFCVVAFECAQGHRMRIANHCHTPSQFALAAKWKLPALLLIREPSEAVISNLVYFDTVNVGSVINRYIQFHRPLVSLKASFLSADFSNVTRDFGQVVRRLNARFGTAFVPFEHTSSNLDRVQARLADMTIKVRAENRTAVGAMPSAAKEAQKEHLRELLRDTKFSSGMELARELYLNLRDV